MSNLPFVLCSFDPDDPAEFHLKEQKKARSEQTSNNNCSRRDYHRQISEINDDDNSDQEQSTNDDERGGLKHSTIVSTPTLYQNGIPTDHAHANRCLICLSDERTATIVHGETGHIACCLTCARVLNARGDSCPVCRLPIDTVIQHFWA
jgi:E3 ubiquitin-protein ligase Mdm2